MGFRDFIKALRVAGRLTTVRKPVSKVLEAAAILNDLDDRPVLFETVRESPFRVVGNLFGTKQRFADYFRIEPHDLIPRMVHAIAHPSKPQETDHAACQASELREAAKAGGGDSSLSRHGCCLSVLVEQVPSGHWRLSRQRAKLS